MDSLVSTSLALRFLPLLLLLSANWISQGHSSFPFEKYIQETCEMTRLPEITVKISYTYNTDQDVDQAEMNHWATVNIQDFKFPYYELPAPAISRSDFRKFEGMVLDAEGYFILRAEAERAGRPPKSLRIIDPLDKRREYLTSDHIVLYVNPKTLDFTLHYRNNQTEMGFHPFSSNPKVIFNGFVFVICGESPASIEQTIGLGPYSYLKKAEL